METDLATEKLQYLIPARTISGSAQDILEELDDMVDALRLVREEVIARTPRPAIEEHPGWLTRAWRAIASRNHGASSAKR